MVEATPPHREGTGAGVHEHDVVIVGAGPVGMFLALELAAFDLDTVVLEVRTTRDERLRARAFNAKTISVLDRRGLAEKIVPATPRAIVHFAGLETIDLSAINADHPYSLYTRQQVLEEALEAELNALDRGPRRGQEVVAIAEEGGGVSVQVESRTTSSSPYTVRGRYVIGCDGGGSAIRRMSGISFTGSPPSMVGYQALVTLDSPRDLVTGWHRSPAGMYAVGPEAGRVIVLEFDTGDDRVEQASVDMEFRAAFERVVGSDIRVTGIDSLTRFTDNCRLAGTYRQGRVLLVGDAAHVHPPFAAQGLNLGLQDASNLGWKLGAHLAWGADTSLLDSYETERRPVALDVIDLSLGQAALMRPDEQTSSFRRVFEEILESPGANHALADRLAGGGVRYRSPTTCECSGAYCNDELVTAGGARSQLSAVQRSRPGRPVLLIGYDWPDSDESVMSSLPSQMVVARSPGGTRGHARASVRMVRPDGYTTWCADDPKDVARLLAGTLQRWFGSSSVGVSAVPERNGIQVHEQNLSGDTSVFDH